MSAQNASPVDREGLLQGHPGSVEGTRGLQSLILDYEYFEKLCAEAIEEQADLCRRIARRAAASQNAGPETRPITGVAEAAPRDDGPPTPARIAQRSMLARNALGTALPLRGKSVVLNGSEADLRDLDAIESRIMLLKYQMQELEHTILETRPTHARAASTKLKFMVALLMSAPHFEKDYFAYLVEECAQVVGAQPT
ncbi:hypothetical protein [Rhodovulum steppense]|uniref:Uncharacterized protein n=1 Tax=Rhodovulum steppense TaxID=540251 RepID=A0A4R1Z2T9_9RHOB|nr:hypothetical protein [Rhodovulum steppense]TCM87992.1 hypothetical protein EV216_1012 [Rhodovulum steppense]